MVQYPPQTGRPPHVMQDRITSNGRRLCYWLTVIQQPERARACGSGAKSSADRRPVDPPPVVELRIWEGEGDNREDVTFAYSANFFLFATLEMARPIAHGRVQAPQQQVPVLTGMPVSGMAYLDRPTEAGYFIFPDLSVRHEGKYRLSFNLYEQTHTKEDKDAEPSPVQDTKPQIPGSTTPDSSFDWRMEVQSAEFTVFSAKKFPGLAESTSLSRTVAEQGCRVRIRRDVRMRRRDEKSNRDYEESQEEYARAAHTPSSIHGFRERSRSLSSEREEQRPGGNLNFGAGYASAPQFATPMAPAQYPQPYPPGPSQYRAPMPPHQPLQPLNYGERAYGYGPHSAYPSTQPREREYEPEYRRSSYPTSVPHSGPYPPLDTGYSRHPVGYSGPPQSSTTLPPLRGSFDAQSSQTSPSGLQSSIPSKIAPDLPSPSYERFQDRSYGPPAMPLHPPADLARTGKRGYDIAFVASASRQNEPLYNHARPSSSHHNPAYDEDEEITLGVMQYKRASGEKVTRDLPQALE